MFSKNLHLAGYVFALLLPIICSTTVLAQITIAVNPANLQDPRVAHVNPAIAAAATPRTYLGLRLIYPGVVDNNTFGIKSSLFNIATPDFAGTNIGAALHGLYFTTPLYNESKFGVAGAKRLGEQFSLGLDLALHSRRYAMENFDGVDLNDPLFREDTGRTVLDLSAGGLYQLNEMISFAASLSHFNRPNLSLGGSEFKQPMEILFGAAFTRQFARLDLGAHYWQNEFRPLFGAEFSAANAGRLRLGFALNNASLEGQLRVLESASLFYSFNLPTSDLGLVSAGSHEIGFVYDFGLRSSRSEAEVKKDIPLLAQPGTLSIRPGETAECRLRLQSAEGMSQLLDLNLEGAPPGIRISPSRLNLSSREPAVIRLHADQSVKPGEYDMLVRADNPAIRGETPIGLRILDVPKLFARVVATIDTVVITESREVREELPIIPRVFFAAHSDTLTLARYDLLAEGQGGIFYSDVHEINAAYRNLLNIVAERLRARPQTRILVRGFSPGPPAENNPQNLARRRAEYVRDYLVNVLQVEGRQIRTETGTVRIREATRNNPPRLEELQCVDLVVAPEDEEAILAPIMSEKKEIDTVPTRCGFVRHDLLAESKLSHWSLTLLAKQDTIRVLAGHATLPDTIWWDWQFDPRRRAGFWQEVRYSLQLADEWGQSFSTPWQTIHSMQTSTAALQIERIPIILFEFDEHEMDLSSSRLRTKLRQIAAKLKAEPRAQAILYGHTDEIGETEHNQQLSVRRAQSVLAELVQLGIAPERLSLQGLGESKPLAKNSLPEGRMLNRRVEVHIRHAEKSR